MTYESKTALGLSVVADSWRVCTTGIIAANKPLPWSWSSFSRNECSSDSDRRPASTVSVTDHRIRTATVRDAARFCIRYSKRNKPVSHLSRIYNAQCWVCSSCLVYYLVPTVPLAISVTKSMRGGAAPAPAAPRLCLRAARPSTPPWRSSARCAAGPGPRLLRLCLHRAARAAARSPVPPLAPRQRG